MVSVGLEVIWGGFWGAGCGCNYILWLFFLFYRRLFFFLPAAFSPYLPLSAMFELTRIFALNLNFEYHILTYEHAFGNFFYMLCSASIIVVTLCLSQILEGDERWRECVTWKTCILLTQLNNRAAIIPTAYTSGCTSYILTRDVRHSIYFCRSTTSFVFKMLTECPWYFSIVLNRKNLLFFRFLYRFYKVEKIFYYLQLKRICYIF